MTDKPEGCHALRQGDEWHCPTCHVRWAHDDPSPPYCHVADLERMTQDTLRKIATQSATTKATISTVTHRGWKHLFR